MIPPCVAEMYARWRKMFKSTIIAVSARPESHVNQTPSRRLATLDDLLLFRVARLSNDAGAMVVRLCEGLRHRPTQWRLMVALQQTRQIQPSALADQIPPRPRTNLPGTHLAAGKGTGVPCRGGRRWSARPVP